MDKAQLGQMYFEMIKEQADKIRYHAQAGEYCQAILKAVIVIEAQNEVIRMLIGLSHVKPVYKHDR